MFKWFRKTDKPGSREIDSELQESEDISEDQISSPLEEESDQVQANSDNNQESLANEDGDISNTPEQAMAEPDATNESDSPSEDEAPGQEKKRQGFFSKLFGGKSEEAPSEESADLLAQDDQARTTEVEIFVETPDDSSDPLSSEAQVDEDAMAAEDDAEQPEEEPQGEDLPSETAPIESMPADSEEQEDTELPRKGILAKFRDKLSATRHKLAGRIENLLSSVRSIDEDVLDELEELLITSDMGTKTTGDLLYKIRGQVASQELSDPAALKEALKKRIGEMVAVPLKPMPKFTPLVIMVVGINGVGKTTTIAKLTKRMQKDGKKVLLAAGDTFRSAAVEQLTVWAERLKADIVAQPTGSDPSAVVFDALNAAQARGSDVVIIDTAGRLHTKVNLMDELKKIKRVAGKAMAGAPHHTILVLDGNTGQNALKQAQTFHEAVGVDSIIMTKLDGTAKGGVIVSIANELKIPITHIGLGESFDDLQPFDAEAFTEAILSA